MKLLETSSRRVRGDSWLRDAQDARLAALRVLDHFLHWRVELDPWDLEPFLAEQPLPELAPEHFEGIVGAILEVTPKLEGARVLEWFVGNEGSRVLYLRLNGAYLPREERSRALSAWAVQLERIGKDFNAGEIGVTVGLEEAEVRLWWD
ncbi:MAG: hypothetical protein HC933_10110 [Pleurocapsa sp. SU_196_0]|nr:hypothetical protein [Pleurocapsa sp. SU_196_0]